MSSKACADAEYTRLHAYCQVAVGRVLVVASRDDLDGQNGRLVLDSVNDVPTGSFKDLDVAIEAASHESAAIGCETQRSDGLLVVADQVEGSGGNEIQHADVVISSSEDSGSGKHWKNALNRSRMLKSHDSRVAARARIPQLDC